MAEGAPSESHATGSQIHPLLRQRMLNRAATFSEGAHPMPPLRRRSSMLSDYSDTRHSFRSSTDNLLRTGANDMDKLTSTGEPSVWHSAPLAFAILPAVGGLLFQNGSSMVTDILLLGFGSMFLNWCVRAPWDWYYAAQRIQYVEAEEGQPSDTILEEDEETESAHDEARSASPAPVPNDSTEKRNRRVAKPKNKAQEDASRELAREEMWALIACFLGPLLGAYLLHGLRSQLTRPAEGLVSNYNLTIFIMAAELRPVSHIIKLKQARMVHLQRIVRVESSDKGSGVDVQELSRRLSDVEARFAESLTSNDVESMKIRATVRQDLQPQLDALNRAVRRYEKRQAAQSIQIEARFVEQEVRLQDALSLAAAAARSGQQSGPISVMFTWIVGVVTYTFQTAWDTAMYPFRVITSFVAVWRSWLRSWFVESERKRYTPVGAQETKARTKSETSILAKGRAKWRG